MKQNWKPRAETHLLNFELWWGNITSSVKVRMIYASSTWRMYSLLMTSMFVRNTFVGANIWEREEGKLNTGFWLANGQNTRLSLVRGQKTRLSLVKILNYVQTAAASLTCCSCAALQTLPLQRGESTTGFWLVRGQNTGFWLANSWGEKVRWGKLWTCFKYNR